MRKIFNYIEPIFFYFEKLGKEKYRINVDTNINKYRYSEVFSVGDICDNSERTIEEVLSELSSWLPNKRRFFCSSKNIMNKILTSSFIEEISSLLVKKVSNNIWAEMLNYADVDSMLNNIGIGSIDELDFISSDDIFDKLRSAYESIVYGKNDENLISLAWNTYDAMNKYKESLSWVEMARGGQQDLNELFSVCGNHMLGSFFDISKEKKNVFIENQKISLIVNRETAISDIQENSMLKTSKVYIDIKKIDNYYDFYIYVSGGISSKISIEKNQIKNMKWSVNNLIPQRRAFIGFGDETLFNARKIIEISDENKSLKSIMEEITATYIDLKKPFEKILIGKDLNDILNMFKIKKTSSQCKNISLLDDIVFKNIPKSIEVCVKECYKYMIPMDIKKFDEIYKNLFNAVWGQSFKYFYNVSSQVNI